MSDREDIESTADVLNRLQLSHDAYQLQQDAEERDVKDMKDAGLPPPQSFSFKRGTPNRWVASYVHVVDAETGQEIEDAAIWRANQAEGWYDTYEFETADNGMRIYKTNETGDGAKWSRVHKPIRIVWNDDQS